MTARANAVAVAALAALAAAAWAALAVSADETPMEPPAFLAGWAVMMTAMMLPSAAPMVLLHPARGRLQLVIGYLIVWASVGVPVYALHRTFDLMSVPAVAVGGVLAAAGIYQLTPLKAACLRQCRTPADFLVMRWGRGPLRLGLEHGAYCVGCCWALMAVLVVAGAMALAWAAAIALVVFAEKVLPRGDLVARATAGLLLVGAAVTVLLG